MTFSLDRNLVRRAFRNLGAIIQDNDAVRDVHNRFHHMLNHDDRDAALPNFLDSIYHARRFQTA